jgi:hypothetical protein
VTTLAAATKKVRFFVTISLIETTINRGVSAWSPQGAKALVLIAVTSFGSR